MRRVTVLLTLVALGLALAAGGYALAQDQASPPAGGVATPNAALCATPINEANGTPTTVARTSATAAAPGSGEPSTPVVLSPCATPINPDPTSETADADTEAAVAAVQVRFVDIAFIPNELTIPADTDVMLQFINNGAAAHNFLIEEPEVFSGDLAPGATSEVVVNLPAGTYEFICSIPGHAQAGMVGTLTVE